MLLIVALVAVLGYGGWEFYQYREAKRIHDELTKDYPEKMEKLRQRQQRQQKQNSIDIDDGPAIVLDGENYKLELPASAKGVECVPVSDEQLTQLEQQGYDFIGRPLFVTCNGKEHVELDRAATVSFDLPKDFPKDKYLDLVGILVTDKGPEYRIPDYFALQEGVVRFKTCHFSPVGYGESPINAREEVINYVALNGWQTNMNNKILDKTLKQELKEFGNSIGFADDDLFGIAAKKLFANNTSVELAGVFVDTWDQRHDENATFENAKTLMKYVGKDLLAASFKKLQEDKAKETKILKDIEFSAGGEAIPIYEKELEQIQSRRSKIMEMLCEHLTPENVEKVSTQLGKGASFRECYVMACEYATDFAKGKLKDYATSLCPYVKAVEAVQVGGEITKEYIASEEAKDMWEAYERVAEPDGTIKDEFWNAIVTKKSGAFKTWHNITPEQMRAKFEERYRAKVDLEKRKEEARKLVDTITEHVDLNSINLRDYDYVSRLSKVYNLMERFRKELVNKDGIIHGQYGDLGVPSLVNKELCYVVDMYISSESEEKFYQWLAEEGYLDEQLKKTYDLLDGALWGGEEPVAEPVEEPEEEQSEEQGFQLQLDDYFFIQHTEALTQREMDNGVIGCRYGYYPGEEEKFKAHVVVDGTSFRIEMPEIKHVRNSKPDYDEFNISGYTVSGAFLPPEKLKVKNLVGIYTDVIYFSPSTLHYKAKYHYEREHCERRDNCIITLSEVEEEILPTKQACFGFEFVNDQFKSVKTVFVRFPVTLSRRYTTTCFNETNLTHDGEGFVEIELRRELY